MNNVIGPISKDEWVTLKMLKDSISWLAKNKKNKPTSAALEREKEEYHNLLEAFKK